MHWTTRVTPKRLTTLLPLSKLVLVRLNQPFYPNIWTLWWYVNIMQLEICFVSSKFVLMQLFGWDLKSLWQTANENLCHTLLLAGRLPEAIESYRCMMDGSDDTTKASCLRWSAGKSFIMPPMLNLHPHFTQLSRKNAARSMLPTEMLHSLRVTTTWLFFYIRGRSSWIPQTKPYLSTAVRQNWNKRCGRKHLSMRKRLMTSIFSWSILNFDIHM